MAVDIGREPTANRSRNIEGLQSTLSLICSVYIIPSVVRLRIQAEQSDPSPARRLRPAQHATFIKEMWTVTYDFCSPDVAPEVQQTLVKGRWGIGVGRGKVENKYTRRGDDMCVQ